VSSKAFAELAQSLRIIHLHPLYLLFQVYMVASLAAHFPRYFSGLPTSLPLNGGFCLDALDV